MEGNVIGTDEETKCSCWKGGCGKYETSLAQGDSDDRVVDERRIGRYFVAIVALTDWTNSGDDLNAERGTRRAQTLSSTKSSAIWRMRSMLSSRHLRNQKRSLHLFFL